jgi:peptidyl-dipeptidase A
LADRFRIKSTAPEFESMIKTLACYPIALLALLLMACEPGDQSAVTRAAGHDVLTAEGAIEFVTRAEQELEVLAQEAERMAWVYSTYITQDTEQLSATARKNFTARQVELAAGAARFNEVTGIDGVTRRKLDMLRSGIVMPAPGDAAKMAEQADIGARMGSMYGKGEYCFEDGKCLDLGRLSDVMAESRDPEVLLEAWNGWRQVSPPMKDMYSRQVELANEVAAELGFADLGTMWRLAYDMPPEDFPGELDRLWAEVKPLYEALHCHVRARLGEQYGTDLVDQKGPIPAHLLGNMWAQDWSNIYPLVAPGETVSSYDLSAILKERGFDAITMVQAGEAFFSSLGFDELPDTFWERSQFVKPQDRDVVCHASAWNVDEKDDLRIKMCIKVNAEDFRVIHHELGHNYYQRAYNDKSFLHRNSANDGFHEAVGDTISLSMTPEYLHQIGLIENIPDASGDVALLMKTALEGIAFIPFGLLVDQWRWKVFAGEVGPDGYNDLWWQLREQYQGVKAPSDRPPGAFDPGAKYHVPGNVPYTRYFLARILQYQFHRSLCEMAGFEGPVHRCSIYGDVRAGKALNTMLEMGRSEPWPDVLQSLTGQSEMDATAILDYFAPLKNWLDEQNQGRTCGW